MMKHLSQLNPQFSGTFIGNTSLRIGRFGCALCCLSMTSDLFGCYKSPAEIARMLPLFNAQGELIWSQIAPAFNKKIQFDKRIGDKNHSVRNDAEIKKSILDSPKTVVWLNVANHSHWVFATDVAGNDYRIIDPLDGQPKFAVKTYGNITGSSHLFTP